MKKIEKWGLDYSKTKLKNLLKSLEKDEEGKDRKPSKTEKIYTLCEHLDKKNSFIATENDLFVLKNCYIRLRRSNMANMLIDIFRDVKPLGVWTNRTGTQIYDILWEMNILDEDEQFNLDYYPDYIPFKNGYYNIKTKKFKKYNKNIYITKTFNINYTKSRHCPRFKQTIREMLPNRKDRMRVLTYLAYSLTGIRDIQIFQFWVGNGGNGKSKLISFMIKLMGNLATGITLDALIEDHYSIMKLKSARFNGGSEVDSSNLTIRGTRIFKRLTGEDILSGSNKFKDREEWLNYVKCIFSTNHLPTPFRVQLDEAMLERIQIVEFPVKFRGTKKENANIFDEILEEEGDEVASFLLSLLPLKKKYIKTDIVEATLKWQKYCNEVFRFIDEKMETSDGNIIGKRELYDAFCDWLDEKGITKRFNEISFFEMVSKYGIKQIQQTYDDEFSMRRKRRRVYIDWRILT